MPGPQQRRVSDRPPRDYRRLAALALIAAGIALLAIYAGARYFLRDTGSSADATGDGAPAWSPDSRRIAFSVEHDGQADLFDMNADGTGRRQLTQTTAYEGDPAYSPDAARLAYDTDRDGNFEIYVSDSAGNNPTRLTNDPAKDQSPAWSPDGRRIIFMSDRGPRHQFDVYVMNADGTGVQALTHAGVNWAPRISPIGDLAAVQVDQDIHVIGLTSGSDTRLTFDPQNGMSPSWSPDARRLVFSSGRNGRLELFTMNADGSDQQVLVSMAHGSAIDPAWSPDGAHVAFVYVPDGDKDAKRTSYAIYVVELGSDRVTRLSP